MNGRIRKPEQSRSQETMDRIVDAFEKLLQKRDYETITINDIAKESSTGAGSIYARFDGKQSILLAVHSRVRNKAKAYFQTLFDPAVWTAESLEVSLERIARGMLVWHTRHKRVIKTALLLDDPDIYHNISMSFHPWGEQLALMLMARKPALAESAAISAAFAILQIMTASLQQRAIFGDISPIGHKISDDDFVRVIVAATLGQLHS
jgi:AcrR family transcriptional regulator